MAQQQWEYCMLCIDQSKEHDKRKNLWCYNVWIDYVGSDGNSIRQDIALMSQPLPFNPWRKALGLLGGAGWELVTVQHGNAFGGSFPSYGSALLYQDRIAYFKRLVSLGRAVDEPKLVI